MPNRSAVVVFIDSSCMSNVQGSQLLTRTGHVGVVTQDYADMCSNECRFTYRHISS
jgi:hypothetical protein